MQSQDSPTAGRLTTLTAGQPVVYGGDRVTSVSPELAEAFREGDRLIVVQESGALLHVPQAEHEAASEAVDAAVAAFGSLGGCTDEQITAFFASFADALEDPDVVARVRAANDADVARAQAAGRSTTRLVLNDGMLSDMVEGLRTWRDAPLRREVPLESVEHEGWSVQSRTAPLGVVAFVFEGRPNVFADAAGVVRTGNTVVMRIGSDALGTAEAIMGEAIQPALRDSGLPEGTVSLVRSPARSAGLALFDDRRLALAVARGSGAAVAQLGAVARQAGTPVSLHGTGGAWLVAGESADAERFRAAVTNSLDRKVCNTLNVACLPAGRPDLVGVLLEAVDEAARRRDTSARLHVAEGSRESVPAERFSAQVTIDRADGPHTEPQASDLPLAELGTEWEWENSPEVSLVVVPQVDDAVALFNEHSPQFVVSVISDDESERARVYGGVNAPFVTDGFTRWVDGQYALSTPELGLSNWQGGRLLARGGILSGSSIHTVRYLATITDPDVHR
ncbi:MAG: aldehyde dehydrogenase family protein [Micrococcales bacterium]|nr:aldehyde dehydrogenase family protein [Micrococcales bacterium]